MFMPLFLLAVSAEVVDLFTSRIIKTNVSGLDVASIDAAAISAARNFHINEPKVLTKEWGLRELSQWDCVPPGVARGYGRGSLLLALAPLSGSVEVEVLDPRGHNPPFGKFYKMTLIPGEMLMMWAAQPFTIPPTSEPTLLLSLELGYFGLSAFDLELDPVSFNPSIHS